MAFSLLGAAALAWAAGDGRPEADRAPEGPAFAGAPEPAVGVAPTNRPRAADRAAEAAVLARAATQDGSAETSHHLALKPVDADGIPEALDSPIARALRAIEDCQAHYDRIRDYMCLFAKRERINGRLSEPHVMEMKARTRPRSIYLKFRKPAAGREAIYIEGRHNGKVLAHDVGLGRLIAGTLHLDPTGARAMADCRHPITEAGIGPLLDTLEARWTAELDTNESRVIFHEEQRVGDRPCNRIDVIHTRQSPDFLFYQVHLYIDRDLGLPIRFEAYDWPAGPGATAPLVEEYTYSNLRLNVGLGDLDFDVANEDYAFGRF